MSQFDQDNKFKAQVVMWSKQRLSRMCPQRDYAPTLREIESICWNLGLICVFVFTTFPGIKLTNRYPPQKIGRWRHKKTILKIILSCGYERCAKLAVKSSAMEPVSSLTTATRWELPQNIWILKYLNIFPQYSNHLWKQEMRLTPSVFPSNQNLNKQ